MFQHNESARQHAKGLILWGLGLSAISIIPLTLLFGKEDGLAGPDYLLALVLFLVAIPGVLMFGTAITQFVRGGEFNMSVDGNKIAWNLPSYLGDSFEYSISDVSYIEKKTRIKKSNGKTKEKIKYFLVAKNQERHALKKQSSVDIAAFVEAAIKAGVELKETHTES